jgi:hypothetical protein
VPADTPRYLFIGEKRSATAIRLGVTWVDGRLCAKNLHAALRLLEIDPSACEYGNAFEDDGSSHLLDLVRARVHANHGGQVVALGQKAARELSRIGIPHRTLIHPAARGAIRRTERYQAHVRAILLAAEELTP